MSHPDGKRSASDVGDLLEEPAAKRAKIEDESSAPKLTAEQLEALRRRAEGLDERVEVSDDEVDESDSNNRGQRGGRGGRNDRNKEAAEEDEGERPQGAADSTERSGPKHNYAVLFGFLGEGYQGLQRNPDAKTIEPVLEDALFKIGAISTANRGSYSKISWSRSARTDKGVSAIGCIISAKLMDVPNMVEKVNQELPNDVRVFGVNRVTKNFRAKLKADARHYEYIIPTSCFAPSKFVASEQERQAFVFDGEMRKRVEEVQAVFCGTHNFFNFTSEIKGDDMRANRFVRRFWCSEPYVVEGVEFVTLGVIGQSFVLNQIRKMVAVVVAVVRNRQHLDVVRGLFVPTRERNIHMAPGEGLMLREVLFTTYNSKMKDNPINWEACIPELENFKKAMIVPHLVKSVRKGLFVDWLNFWDDFPMDYDALKQRYLESPLYEKDQKRLKWQEQTAAIEASKKAAAAAATTVAAEAK
eukprot:TRINITY_DN4828_c0_g1_i1.p1 TRINITY_DN4828_c0_g1~~TRINITY_DN4828_c0_g1_i1.p1  ORF type:complete len:471 (+),score=99.57 TRINITY_DN4828_c0_g1_i1:268-1680(+)